LGLGNFVAGGDRADASFKDGNLFLGPIEARADAFINVVDAPLEAIARAAT
jgi:hypothetical protein